MRRVQDIPVENLCDRSGALASRAHSRGEVFYLTKDDKPLAALVPVGMKVKVPPPSALKAAYDAAFPGLPGGMTEEEAKRRLTSALNAAYPHLVDTMERSFQHGVRRAMSEPWRRFEMNEEEPDNPSADALARHIADHPITTIQAAMRILGWSVSLELVMPENESED